MMYMDKPVVSGLEQFETLIILASDFDGLFLSNGPGDPALCSTTVGNIKQFIDSRSERRPLFGICVGHQLLSRAIGAQTFKMKYVINYACESYSSHLSLYLQFPLA